jgi:hypothetical protein
MDVRETVEETGERRDGKREDGERKGKGEIIGVRKTLGVGKGRGEEEMV